MNQIKVGVTAFIMNEKGQILLGKKGRACSPELVGKWVTPGGRVNFKERLYDAVIREVKEETGLDIYVVGEMNSQELIGGDMHFVFSVFRTHPKEEQQELKPGDDLSDVKWFDGEEVSVMSSEGELTPLTEKIIELAFGDEFNE